MNGPGLLATASRVNWRHIDARVFRGYACGDLMEHEDQMRRRMPGPRLRVLVWKLPVSSSTISRPSVACLLSDGSAQGGKRAWGWQLLRKARARAEPKNKTAGMDAGGVPRQATDGGVRISV